jgi:hypothetical protein
MLLHRPADVARLMRPQDVGRHALRLGREQGFDLVHRADQALLLARGQRAQHLRHVAARAGIELGEPLLPDLGQAEEVLPRIEVGGLPLHEPPLLEGLQDAAEIAGIEAKMLGEVRRRHGLAVRQLVDDPCFGQRELAAVIALVQDADLARVEAREAAHRLHAGCLLLHPCLPGDRYDCRR